MPLEELSRYMGHASTQATRRHAVQTAPCAESGVIRAASGREPMRGQTSLSQRIRGERVP